MFADPLAVTIPDPDHSLGEERLIIFGRPGGDRRWDLVPLLGAVLLGRIDERTNHRGFSLDQH